MPGPFAVKLERFTPLSTHGLRALEALCAERVRRYAAREDLAREGERPRHVNLFLSGWACRYKLLADGRRQIIALLLPGDLCDPDVSALQVLDHSVATLSPVTLAQLAPDDVAELCDRDPGIARALRWETLAGAARQREWTVSLGQRTALERMAHLFCELYHRLRFIGLADEDGYECPLTQADIAGVTGLTPVHVNRTLQQMRAGKLIQLERHRLLIPNRAALEQVAFFTPHYLHVASAAPEG